MSTTTRQSLLTARTGSLRFSSRSTEAPVLERPPIVLEYNASVVRIGLAENFKPHYVEALKNSNNDIQKSQQQWYAELAPVISKLWDRLFLASSSSPRRVLVVTVYVMPQTWTTAMTNMLTSLGAIVGVSFVSLLEIIHYGIGWKRGILVHVGRQEIHVVAHVDGRALDDTLQIVPCGYERVVVMNDKETTAVWKDDTMDWHWLDETHNPHSLLFALLKTIEAIPLDAKRDAVSNIVITSEVALVQVLTQLEKRLGQRLVAVLKQDKLPPLSSTMRTDVVTEQESTTTRTPTQYKTMSSLAPHVSIVSTRPNRPDMVSWMAASVWATVMHRQSGFPKVDTRPIV